jgi:hypothetical protein
MGLKGSVNSIVLFIALPFFAPFAAATPPPPFYIIPLRDWTTLIISSPTR